MGETWEKVRSFVRGAWIPAEAAPARTANATASPVEASITAPRSTTTAAPIFREVTPINASSDPVRAFETNAELVNSRLDALEARVHDESQRPTGGTLSSAALLDERLANERLADDRLTAIAAEIAALRETVQTLSAQQETVKALAEELARHIGDLGNAVTGVDQRVTETSRDVRDAQASADEALETLEVSQSELQTWLSMRNREVGQRVAPLYVLTLIALLASLGSAAMAIVMMLD